jgi:hypothetical protein
MNSFEIQSRNLDGGGARRTRAYRMQPSVGPEYWSAVTDVPCPVCPDGVVRWAENGYVPGYRMCDICGRHFLAAGSAEKPLLLRVRYLKRGPMWTRFIKRRTPRAEGPRTAYSKLPLKVCHTVSPAMQDFIENCLVPIMVKQYLRRP